MARSLIYWAWVCWVFHSWPITSTKFKTNCRSWNLTSETTYAWNFCCCWIQVQFSSIPYNFASSNVLASQWNTILNTSSGILNQLTCFVCLFCHGPFKAEVRGITNRKTVLEGYENVQAALLDYTLTCYPSVEVSIGHQVIDLMKFKRNNNSIQCIPMHTLKKLFPIRLFVPLLGNTGKVREIDKYYSGNSCNGSTWWRSSIFETLRWKCSHTDTSHGDVARQAKIMLKATAHYKQKEWSAKDIKNNYLETLRRST